MRWPESGILTLSVSRRRSVGTRRGPTLGWLRVALAFLVLDLHYGFFRGHFQHWIDARIGPLAWVNDGALAVFGFFSISGWLVADMLLSSRYPLRGPLDLVRFVLSRWARIYPLYWIVLAFWLAAMPWSGWATVTANVLLWPFGLWAFFYDQQRFGPLFNHLLLVPAWTLALDLVLYPIGALLAPVRARWAVLWLILAVLWWAVGAWLAPAHTGHAAYIWWHFRYWTGAGAGVLAFLLGLALRKFAMHVPRPPWSAWLALGVAVWCSFLPLGLGYFSASLIAMTAYAWLTHWLAARGRGSREAFLGNFTYALYLVHIPVIAHLSAINSPQVPLLATITSIVIAMILALTVEQPLELLRRRWLTPRLTQTESRSGSWGTTWRVLATAAMVGSTGGYIWMAWHWLP